MAKRATVTFSQAGVQPPVYVVSSLSTPPWEILEMNVEDKETESDHLLFTRHFDDVAEGSYQYKIRIGEGHWVVDESKDSATDDSGNRNNVIHVKHIVVPPPTDLIDGSAKDKRQDSVQVEGDIAHPEADASPPTHPKPIPVSLPVEDAGESGEVESASGQLPSVPVPFTVVEKVSDQPHEAYGDIEAESLHEDDKKRVADAEPDFETVQPASPVATKDAEPATPHIPTVIVEKTDDEPSFGDDFGRDATSAQKVAHEQRLADATPDEVVVTPEATRIDTSRNDPTSDTSSDLEEIMEGPSPLDEESAPLFRHESMKPEPTQDAADEPKPSSMDTIEEESANSSTDHTDSQILTPEEDDADEEDKTDELDNGPLLAHETGFSKHGDSTDELENAPLLPHETGFSRFEKDEQFDEEGSDDEDELEDEDASEISRAVDNIKVDVADPDLAPAFQHELQDEDDEDLQAPLLPHEQDSAIEDGPSLGDEPTFSYEAATPIPVPEQGQDSLFATRTRTVSLPHTIPRSDEDDEDLDDPSLEAFPTDRESILAHMATISSSLPEDQTKELERVESPGLSVLSNACSSVSLGARSGSLKSVVEEDIESDSDSDLPSPALLTSSSGPAVADPANGRTQPQIQSDTSSAARSTETSEADSVQKNDGANDGSKKLENVYDSVATPSNVLQPPTPPLTPTKKDGRGTQEPSSTTDSTGADSAPVEPTKDQHASSSSPASQQSPPTGPKDSWVKGFVRVVFGPAGRVLTSCFGGPKQASTTLLVLGLAIAAYYYSNIFSASAASSNRASA